MQHSRLLSLLVFVSFIPLFAQAPTATIDGRVLDPSKAVLEGARVDATNIDTNLKYTTQTNSAGLFTLVNLPPGTYRLEVSKIGFRTIVKPDIVVHVQDVIALNFDLPLGSVLESVTVEGGAPLVNTEDASVSTVVDRNFAENLPMNGRSFQTLIQLTPGVVLTQSTASDNGQFSVNGQRTTSNYWMVDGVSGNIGVSGFVGGAGLAGAVGSFSAQGGTNSLVSIDAMQEFRIQTSTYAPEFGRTPGAQISILTRSGTNQFHGTAFDYFRNDVLDANDWFADSANLPKAKERQNDFGGTFGGPLIPNRTFFFLSYEGLRLSLPETALTTVPDLAARASASGDLQPYLNSYPLPNGADIGGGVAEFNASFSNRSTLNAYSLRIDHRLGESLTLFGRYNYSPSQNEQRGDDRALNTVQNTKFTTQTFTLGATWLLSSAVTNDLRFNYSKTDADSYDFQDNFGGAVPLPSLPLPSPFTAQTSQFNMNIFSLTNGGQIVGRNGQNTQRQLNLVDGVSVQKDAHSLKFGIDFRRLSPIVNPAQYGQSALFDDVPSAETGTLDLSFLTSEKKETVLFRNLGVYAQDTWRLGPRFTLTYGVRWDVDFSPSSINGPSFPAVTNANDLANLALAPSGTAPFQTRSGNVAPRLGMAYHLRQDPNWQAVLRGGIGVFFDLATSETGNLIANSGYPFGTFAINFGGSFPLDPATAAPPPIVPPDAQNGQLVGFDPQLRLPYTLQWNVALEQSLGRKQVLSASYIGSSGRRLLQSTQIASPNPNLALALLVSNSASSNYNALQVKFERRLSRGLQALASYAWSHSIDDGSTGSYGNAGNTGVPGLNQAVNRGPSDFDIRNAFSAGVTYELPAIGAGRFTRVLLKGWSVENVIQAHSALPLNVFDGEFFELFNATALVRPDIVPGEPFYLRGRQYPGNLALNRAAFASPPTDANGNPLRQGNLGRNVLTGFGLTQWDFALHRDFEIHESIKLQFRAEMFNILNHPNFAPPVANLRRANFGLSTQMLGQYLGSGTVGFGGFSPLYQIGGPRSIQFALKLSF
jgi:hypothetical protein